LQLSICSISEEARRRKKGKAKVVHGDEDKLKFMPSWHTISKQRSIVPKTNMEVK